jgi:hypothetical protein
LLIAAPLGAIKMQGTFQHSSNSTPDKRRRNNDAFPFFRIAQLERVIVDRYGERCLPNDDGGHDILLPMADHLAQVDPIRIRRWAAAWMPGLPAADVDDLITSREALIAECGKTALHWNADALAHEIDLDYAARTRTKSTTIGATDCDATQREELRKITRAAAARAKRAAAGATPRAQSITATKPWIKDGFSTRRTWERHGKRPRVANSRPATSSSPSMLVTDLRHDEKRAHSDRRSRRPAVAAGAVREMGQAGDATSSIAKPLSSSIHVRQMSDQEKAAGLERERLHLQERARLHLQEVRFTVMQSDDPASWHPVLVAATSEWRGHHLIDDHHDHHHAHEQRA